MHSVTRRAFSGGLSIAAGEVCSPSSWAQISGSLSDIPDKTPDQAKAANVTLSRHAPWTIHPGGAVAGACANAFARLGDGDKKSPSASSAR